MAAIIDTATDLVAVEGSDCLRCQSRTYDIKENIDSGIATVESGTVIERYGEAQIIGQYAKDDFCFQLGKCVNLEFLYITDQGVLDKNVDAIVGFARPDHPFLLAPGSVRSDQTMFLEVFRDTFFGEEPFFSTRFQRDYISWIDIGMPDESQSKSEPVTIDCFDDFFWSMALQGVRFGTSSDMAFTFNLMEHGAQINDGLYTIWDSAAPNIYLSVLWFESFVAQLYEITGLEIVIVNGKVKAACATSYPDLYFQLNGYWLQVKPADYIREEDSNVCSLKIMPINAPFNIMGMPAYIGYYIQHNWEQG